jgi:hypothetical protein
LPAGGADVGAIHEWQPIEIDAEYQDEKDAGEEGWQGEAHKGERARDLIEDRISLIGISVVLFTVLALAPGDPFEELATNANVPAAVRAALRLKFGLDDPIAIRYLRWFSAMLHGDWGFSFVSRIDVDVLILQRLPTTLFVIGSSQVLALLIALPVGIYTAARPHGAIGLVVLVAMPAGDVAALPLVLLGRDLPGDKLVHKELGVRLIREYVVHLQIAVELRISIGIGHIGGEVHRRADRLELHFDAGLLARLFDHGLGLLAGRVDRGLTHKAQFPVIGREGLTIVPTDVLFELPGHRHSVAGKPPVFKIGNLGRQHRHQISLGVPAG